MSKIKQIRQKQSNGTFGAPFNLGADAVNVDMSTGGNADEAILKRVTQDFTSSGTGAATPINADTFQGMNVADFDARYKLTNSAASHNAVYRGENLLGSGHFASIDAIGNAISAGDWSDIFVGDYFDVNIPAGSVAKPDGSTYTVSAQPVRLVVMDLEPYWHCGDTILGRHHVALVPRDCLRETAFMNSTDVTTGGYYNSWMHQTLLPKLAELFSGPLGSHLISYRDLFTNSVNNDLPSSGHSGWKGSTNGWAWYDAKLRLLNEDAVFGAPVFSSSGYDTGIMNRQLSGFRLNPELRIKHGGYGSGGRWHWWLSSVASSTYFALVASHGGSVTWVASDLCGVVPQILFG